MIVHDDILEEKKIMRSAIGDAVQAPIDWESEILSRTMTTLFPPTDDPKPITVSKLWALMGGGAFKDGMHPAKEIKSCPFT